MGRYTLILVGLVSLVLTAGAPKQEALAVRVYPEAGTEGGNFASPVELKNGRKTTMTSMPLINESSIQSYHSFPAPDGSGTFGVYFRLDAHGTNLLSQHTMSRKGTWLLVFLNGRHVVDLYIDRGVGDGILSIPTGFTATDIETFKYRFPPFGEEGAKPPKRPKPVKKPKTETETEA